MKKNWLPYYARQSVGRALFTLCIFGPVLFAIIRKFTPGQPTMVRFFSVGIIFVAGFFSLFRKQRLPSEISGPLALWGGLLFVYALPGMTVGPRFFAAAVLIYIVPLSLARISFIALADVDDVLRLGRWLGILILSMLPVALVVTIFGNEVLPDFLRATYAAREAHAEMTKSAFEAPSAVFSTPSVLADTIFAATYMCLACLEISRKERKTEVIWWVFILAGALIVYLTGRRGMFIFLLPGLIYAILHLRIKIRWRALAIASLGAAIIIFDSLVDTGTRTYQARTDLYVDMPWHYRFTEIFLGLTRRWLEISPFGNFVGYGSALAHRFYLTLPSAVEVGAASLVAEMGIVGLVVMPLVVAALFWWCLRKSWSSRYRRAIHHLLAFQFCLFVLFYTKAAAHLTIFSVAHLLFWANWGICAVLIREGQEDPPPAPPRIHFVDSPSIPRQKQ